MPSAASSASSTIAVIAVSSSLPIVLPLAQRLPLAAARRCARVSIPTPSSLSAARKRPVIAP